jgi:hypothetical protein
VLAVRLLFGTDELSPAILFPEHALNKIIVSRKKIDFVGKTFISLIVKRLPKDCNALRSPAARRNMFNEQT